MVKMQNLFKCIKDKLFFVLKIKIIILNALYVIDIYVIIVHFILIVKKINGYLVV